MTTEKTCFVVQGYGEKTDFPTGRKLNLDASYQVIKEAVEEAGLECIRGDEIKHSGTIDEPMYQQIMRADLVIADLSTYNVNAAYELGVRYGLRPFATIIVAEDQFKNPFDISHIVIRNYKHLGEDIGVSEARRFKKDLQEAIKEILAAQKTDSPVYCCLQNLRPPAEQPVCEVSSKVSEVFPERETTRGVENLSLTMQPVAMESASANMPPAEGTDQSSKQLLDLGRQAMAQGEFNSAKPFFQALRQLRPNDDYVVQQLALATYKSKRKQPDETAALEEARTLLQSLNPETTNDPETLGIWGAVQKRLWELNQDRPSLEEAMDAYARGFFLKQDYYNGINLAFLFNIRAALEEQEGNTAEAITDFILARRTRQQVMQLCKNALDQGVKSTDDKYWILATLWEAAVGLEDASAASEWQRQAEAAASAQWRLDRTSSQLEYLTQLLSASPLKHLSGV